MRAAALAAPAFAVLAVLGMVVAVRAERAGARHRGAARGLRLAASVCAILAALALVVSGVVGA